MPLIDNIRKISFMDLEKDEDLLESEIRRINPRPKKILFTQDESRLNNDNYKNAFSIDRELINSNLKFKFPETAMEDEVDDDYLNPVLVIVD